MLVDGSIEKVLPRTFQPMFLGESGKQARGGSEVGD